MPPWRHVASCFSSEVSGHSFYFPLVLVDMAQPGEWRSFLKDSSDLSAGQGSARHVCSFISLNALVLAWLVNYFNANDRLSGLQFALAGALCLTYAIFHNPYRLKFTGYVHMRVLKWVHVIFSVSFLVFLFRSHTPSCSSMVLAISIGLKLFRELPFAFPRSFTFNELVVVCVLVSAGLFAFLMHFLVIIPAERIEIIIVEQALIWLVVVVVLAANFPFARASLLGFSATCALALAGYFVPVCLVLTNQNPFVWLVDYLLFRSPQRIFLFAYWLALFACMGLVVAVQRSLISRDAGARDAERLVTAMRKVFHLLICFVYLLGLANDRHLLHLCSFGMLILLALVELVRIARMGAAGRFVAELTRLFADEKDAGATLVLSHVFLLVGLSYPIWIGGGGLDAFHVAQLSGLLTVGVGDTFASLVGSRFGRHRFPGSKKSLEGSLAMALSQLVVFVALDRLGFLSLVEPRTLVLVLTSLTVSAFVEAFTRDNDNLVLPVCVYPILSLIS